MKRYRIVNKKKFTFFIFSLFLILSSLSFGIFYFGKKIMELRSKQIKIYQSEEPVQAPVIRQEEVKLPQQSTVEQEVTEQKLNLLTEYQNLTYGYGLKFPDKWFMNNDDSDSKFEEVRNQEKKKLIAGGQTFWSNYQDINKYTPNSKPDDFHLLSLIVYKDPSATIDEFASKLGAKEFAVPQEIQASDIVGMQYISGGLDEKNPNITVIYKKNDLFYVFKPAFVNGDENAADIMEQIVKSFKISN